MNITIVIFVMLVFACLCIFWKIQQNQETMPKDTLFVEVYLTYVVFDYSKDVICIFELPA